MIWIFNPQTRRDLEPDFCDHTCWIQYGCTTNFALPCDIHQPGCAEWDGGGGGTCQDLYFPDPCITLGQEPCPTFDTCYPVY